MIKQNNKTSTGAYLHGNGDQRWLKGDEDVASDVCDTDEGQVASDADTQVDEGAQVNGARHHSVHRLQRRLRQ